MPSIDLNNTTLLEGLADIVGAANGLEDTTLLLVSNPSTETDPGEYKTDIATLVTRAQAGMVPVLNGVLQGAPEAPTAGLGSANDQLANTEFVATAIAIDNISKGAIRLWEPDQEYRAAGTETINTVVYNYPADLVYHNGELFVTMVTHISEPAFTELMPDLTTVALKRIRLNDDPEHIEITASAVGPFVTNQELGGYIAIREMSVHLQQRLPNARIWSTETFHKAACNSGISGINIVTIKRYNAAGDVITTVGTITFDPTGITALAIPGVVELAGAATHIPLMRGDMLVFELSTRTVELDWVRINLLATTLGFDNTDFNRPE